MLGVGEAYEIVEPTQLAELARRLPVLWAADRAQHMISIPLQRLTGQRFA